MLLVGLALISAGLAVLARIPPDAQFLVDVLPAILAMGAGGGLAILMSLAAARTAGSTESGGGTAVALTLGYRLGFTVGAGIVVAALILAAFGLRSGPTHRGHLADGGGSTTRARRRPALRPQ